MSFAHVHAAGYARVLSAAPGVEVVATDPDHHRRPGETGGASMAADLKVDYVADYPALLATRPDGVVVCAENAEHRRLATLAAEAGAHVLCEKPIATTLADAHAMTAACAEAGVQLMIAHPVRFSPAVAALQQTLAAGTLGEVLSITGTNNGRIPRDRSWFVDPAAAGGGALTDHLVHVLDLLELLWPSARVRSVYAVANRILGDGTGEVDTGGLAALRLALAADGSADGRREVPVVIDVSWSRPDGWPTWGGLTLRLIGTGGIGTADPFASRLAGHLSSTGTGTGTGAWIPYGPDLDALLLHAFLEVVAGAAPAAPDGAAGTRGLAVVLAAYESVASGQPVVPQA